MTRSLLIFYFSIMCCNPVLAETAVNSESIYQSSDILASSFRVVWGLLIVLGVILILYALLRKRFSVFSNTSQKEINVLEIKPLLGKKALCLIEVRGQEYLLGISDNNISNIATLAPKTTKDKSFKETLLEKTGELE